MVEVENDADGIHLPLPTQTASGPQRPRWCASGAGPGPAANATRTRWARNPPIAEAPDRDAALPAHVEAAVAHLPGLVAEFEGHGLQVRFADRTGGRPIPPAIGALLFDLVKDGMTAAHAQHAPGQVLHTRIRIDGDQVILSTQTSGTTDQAPSYTPDARHRAALRAQVDEVGGQVIIRQTSRGTGWPACASRYRRPAERQAACAFRIPGCARS